MDAYKAKVFKFLNNGEYGESYTIDRICAKENQPLWIEHVKEYMHQTPWQGGWEFTHNGTKLRRVDLNFNKKQRNTLKIYR